MTRVYIAAHDDGGYIVNTIDDMHENYNDMADEGSLPDGMLFSAYLRSWAHLDMPNHVLSNPDPAVRNTWIDQQALA